jgi:hypothetical protein
VRSPLPRSLLALVAATSLALAACPSSNHTRVIDGHPIAGWSGAEATLFDDGIDVGALPAAANVEATRDETNDAMIGARLRDADGVVIAKVKGLTREPVGEKTRFVVELAVEGEPLSGKSPGDALVLRIGPESPAFGTIRARESDLVGRRVVVYFRIYAPSEGSDAQEAIVHFHLSGTAPALLEEIKKQAQNLKP